MRLLPHAIALALSAPAWCAVQYRLAMVTAYTPSIDGGGAGTGLTASGTRTDADPFGVAACSSMLPMGARVRIPGYRDTPEKGGPWWTVDDRGAALRKSAARGVLHLDVRMRHVESARAWGVRWLVVGVWVPD